MNEQEKQDRINQTIHRTPNPECPACKEYRIHAEAGWEKYHPLRGTGQARS